MKSSSAGWFACTVFLAFIQSACGSAPADDGDGDSGTGGARYELEGTWVDRNGMVIAFDGDVARLVSFGGRVTGRQFVDVGYEYIRAIERVDGSHFTGEVAQVGSMSGDEILHFTEVPGRNPFRLMMTDSEFTLTETGTKFTRSTHAADDYEYGGACEKWEPAPGSLERIYICDDSGTEDMCTSVFEARFWENTTCRQLGYAYQDSTAKFQHDAESDMLPGEHGEWGDASGGSGAGWSDGSGGSSPYDGPLNPIMDGGVSSVDGGVTDADAGTDGGTPAPPTDASTAETGSYLIYGVVWDQATNDCPEGSGIYNDAIAWYWQIVDGAYSDTYQSASADFEAMMRSSHPGAKEYEVQSSWFAYGEEASHAVVIDYVRQVPSWDCRPYLITIGYGASYEEALADALETKNNNDAESAPYTELRHLTWKP